MFKIASLFNSLRKSTKLWRLHTAGVTCSRCAARASEGRIWVEHGLAWTAQILRAGPLPANRQRDLPLDGGHAAVGPLTIISAINPTRLTTLPWVHHAPLQEAD